MRIDVLALILSSSIATSALAANVFYSPFINPNTNQRNVLYLSDSRVAYCPPPRRAAHVEDDSGKIVKTGPICWWFSANGDGFDVEFMATGGKQYNATGFGVVPGAGEQYKKLMSEFAGQQRQRVESIQRSMNTPLNVHP